MTGEELARVIFCAVNEYDPSEEADHIDAASAGRRYCDGAWIKADDARTAAKSAFAALRPSRATPDTAPLSGEDAPDFALTHPEVYDMASGEDALATVIAPGEVREAQQTIAILRRALAWHGDLQRMATTREEWQQEVDAAIVWVKANPEPDRPSFSTLAQPRQPDERVERKPFAYFQWNEDWNLWEQVIEEAAAESHVLAAYCQPGAVNAARAALATPADDGEQRG